MPPLLPRPDEFAQQSVQSKGKVSRLSCVADVKGQVMKRSVVDFGHLQSSQLAVDRLPK
jgi:hypothetical protein